MLRALLLLACTAKVAAFAQAPAGEPGCVDLDPEVIQLAQAVQDDEVDVEVEAGMPTMTSCADVAASGGCANEEVAAFCCATCALPQRMTYSASSDLARVMMCFVKKLNCYVAGRIPYVQPRDPTTGSWLPGRKSYCDLDANYRYCRNRFFEDDAFRMEVCGLCRPHAFVTHECC